METYGTEPLVRAPHIRETHNQDGAVLLDPERGRCYPLTPVEALIWKQLGEGLALAQIAQNVATECNVSLDLVLADVQEYVRSLLDADLLSRPKSAEFHDPRWAWLRRLLGRSSRGAESAARNH